MSLKIMVQGGPNNPEVFLELEEMEPRTRRAVRQFWFSMARDMKSASNREILYGRKTGNVYRIKRKDGTFRRHQASAPGEVHANLTGKLRRSLSWQVQGVEHMEFGYGVRADGGGAQAPVYAKFVQWGTSRMEARPSLEFGIEAAQGNAQQHLDFGMAREFNTL